MGALSKLLKLSKEQSNVYGLGPGFDFSNRGTTGTIDLYLTKKVLKLPDPDIPKKDYPFSNRMKKKKKGRIPEWFTEKLDPKPTKFREHWRAVIQKLILIAGLKGDSVPLRILQRIDFENSKYTVFLVRLITDTCVLTLYIRRSDVYFLAFNYWSLTSEASHKFWRHRWMRLGDQTELEDMMVMNPKGGEFIDKKHTFKVNVNYTQASNSLKLGKYPLQSAVESFEKVCENFVDQRCVNKVSDEERERAKDVICFSICEAARRKQIFDKIFFCMSSGFTLDDDKDNVVQFYVEEEDEDEDDEVDEDEDEDEEEDEDEDEEKDEENDDDDDVETEEEVEEKKDVVDLMHLAKTWGGTCTLIVAGNKGKNEDYFGITLLKAPNSGDVKVKGKDNGKKNKGKAKAKVEAEDQKDKFEDPWTKRKQLEELKLKEELARNNKSNRKLKRGSGAVSSSGSGPSRRQKQA